MTVSMRKSPKHSTILGTKVHDFLKLTTRRYKLLLNNHWIRTSLARAPIEQPQIVAAFFIAKVQA